MQTIPKSTIVYGDNNYSLNDQIRLIYDKYIADTASLQINISFSAREKIKEVIFGTNNDDETLIQCLDEAVQEIRLLLSGSFLRFKNGGNIDLDAPENNMEDINKQIIIALQKETCR